MSQRYHELLGTPFSKQTLDKPNISIQDVAHLADIRPILDAEFSIIKDSDINLFIKKCKELFQEFNQNSTLVDLSKQSLEHYKTCLLQINQSSLTTQNKSKLHRMIHSLKDFVLIITPILQTDTLKNILDQDYDDADRLDFEKALYGAMFALICVLVSINVFDKVDPNSLSILINQGCDFAESLCGHTDTFDLLSNPDDRKFILSQKIDI